MADDQIQPQPEETPTQTTEPVTPTETPPQPVEEPTLQESPTPEENTQTPTTENSQPATETQPAQQTDAPISTPTVSIPQLHYPFSGNFSVTFAFGAQSDNEEIKKKYAEWGITGHNGLDFGLAERTEVYPCDNGKVIQSGENGDFGNSITLEHSWGTSLYAHLKETKVNVGDTAEVNHVIGLSGKTGAAFGEHLHFAIKPTNPDANNGYLGFVDPAPFLSLPSQKEETKTEQPTTPPAEEQKPMEETKPSEAIQSQPEQPKPEEAQQPQDEIIPPPIKLEPEKPVEPEPLQNPQTTEINPEEIQKQVEDPELNRRVDEKLKVELDARRQKANQARQTKREENLMKIEKLIEEKKQINNQDVCDLLHVSQSTATNYLADLVNRGTIKTEGKGKATIYRY